MFPELHVVVSQYCSTHTVEECINFATKELISDYALLGIMLIVFFVAILILRIYEIKTEDKPIQIFKKQFWIDFWRSI